MLQEATCTISIAPEGWYLVLKNPAKDGSHPRTGALNNLPELKIGRKVNIPGPISFALWPGQMVRVIEGHVLESNQYLEVRIYNEERARDGWNVALGEDAEAEPPTLEVGQSLVIRGGERLRFE